jgi:hypothetical protein
MLALHGFWSRQGGLCLWAEDPAAAVKSGSHAMRSARPHPFAASASTLAAIHGGKPAEAVLLLPSLGTAPLDSPELKAITTLRGVPKPESDQVRPVSAGPQRYDCAIKLTGAEFRVDDT